MNCFYAPDQSAVGICKSCGKGLSREYAVDLGNGLACKDRCEERVSKINLMIDTNSKVMTVANTQLRRNSIFMVISGLLFIALGFFMGLPTYQPVALIFAFLGITFIFRAILGYTRAARYPTSELIPQGTHKS